MELLDTLFDERSNCYSFITKMTFNEYLDLIERAYENRGHLDGQRDKLSTTTAIRIRKRMVEDLRFGAVFPPVVIGVLVPAENFENITEWINANIADVFDTIDEESLSIIDGMQRTTAYKELQPTQGDKFVRVEFWASKSIENLTYRMLVLNTGQVPWNLRRQLEVVYRPLIKTIKEKLFEQYPELVGQITISLVDDHLSRTRGGLFHAHNIIEAYIAFGLRKDKVDTQTVLADEFSKLDMIDAMSNRNFVAEFVTVFGGMCKLDLAFSRWSETLSSVVGNYNIGKNIFDRQPPKIGFFTATAHKIIGMPGITREQEEQTQSLSKVKARCSDISRLVDEITDLEHAKEFFQFDVLNEKIARLPANRIGDEERAFFREAFKIFFDDNIQLTTLLPCWRAY